jgi:hypothetical protein
MTFSTDGRQAFYRLFADSAHASNGIVVRAGQRDRMLS